MEAPAREQLTVAIELLQAMDMRIRLEHAAAEYRALR
jgi:hypothetical protein